MDWLKLPTGLEFECFIIFNMFVLMFFFGFVVHTVVRYGAVMVGIVLRDYFEQKMKFLQELSKFEVPEEVGRKKSSFN